MRLRCAMMSKAAFSPCWEEDQYPCGSIAFECHRAVDAQRLLAHAVRAAQIGQINHEQRRIDLWLCAV